jgi:carboxyl-terminal processing protease
MAKYYTPSLRTIHEVGVAPDIEVPISDEEDRRILLSETKRQLTADEAAEVAKMEDRQLERAVASLQTVRIYNERQAALNAVAPKPAADGAAAPDVTR